MSVAPEGKEADRKFSTVRSEVLRSANGTTIQDRDVDARLGITDVIAYKFENALVAKPAIKYYMLMLVTLVIMLVRIQRLLTELVVRRPAPDPWMVLDVRCRQEHRARCDV